METQNLLTNVVFFLAAAVIAVPIFVRLGLGSVLGYLTAGVIIGPWVLGLISNVDDILHFSEFGVVMLLFLIGLELEPKKLWSMRRSILGSGGAQLAISSAIIGAAAMFFGLGWKSALVIGLGLALSSTAIALQTLQERNLMATTAGKSGFSILLFQDIAVIPIIALMPILGSALLVEDSHAGVSQFSTPTVIAILIGLFVLSRLLLKHVFRLIAKTQLREIFTMLSLLLVIGIAVIMDSFGISMALGAFLAGVILADSEYRHTLESDIEPFKGLLLGLFFVSVGMSIDFGLLFASPLIFFGLAILLILIKVLVLVLVARVSGVPIQQTAFFSILLSQGGEFAFVLFGLAVGLNIFEQTLASQMILVVAISMIFTPLLMMVNERFIEPLLARNQEREMDLIDSADQENKVIIAGFGRFGQVVARLLFANKITPTLIDYDPDQIELVRKFGTKAYYGDVLRSDVLHSAGADKATLIILTIDNEDGINKAVELIRKDFPNTKIIARAMSRPHALHLLQLGVDHFTRETFYSALEMGKDAMSVMGFEQAEIDRQSEILRNHDVEFLYQQFDIKDDQAEMISRSRQARARLEQILAADFEVDRPAQANSEANSEANPETNSVTGEAEEKAGEEPGEAARNNHD